MADLERDATQMWRMPIPEITTARKPIVISGWSPERGRLVKQCRVVFTWAHDENCQAEYEKGLCEQMARCGYRAHVEIAQGTDALNKNNWTRPTSEDQWEAAAQFLAHYILENVPRESAND